MRHLSKPIEDLADYHQLCKSVKKILTTCSALSTGCRNPDCKWPTRISGTPYCNWHPVWAWALTTVASRLCPYHYNWHPVGPLPLHLFVYALITGTGILFGLYHCNLHTVWPLTLLLVSCLGPYHCNWHPGIY